MNPKLAKLQAYPFDKLRPLFKDTTPVPRHNGRVAAGSVVVSGNLPAVDGRYGQYCGVSVKRVDAKTRAKTSSNELLRGN